MIPDLDKKVRFVASMGVQVRLAQGKDHATIRREVVAVAVEAMKKLARDDFEAEQVVMVVQRTVDAMLDNLPPAA